MSTLQISLFIIIISVVGIFVVTTAAYHADGAKVSRHNHNHHEALLNPSLLVEEGIAVGSLGNYTGAISYYDKALALEPNDMYTLKAKSATLDKLGTATHFEISKTNNSAPHFEICYKGRCTPTGTGTQ